MRYVLVCLGLILTACIDDAAPTESEESSGQMDATTPGSSGETDACLTDDWFCFEGAPDAAPVEVPDAGKPPADGPKPPMGDFVGELTQKKVSGWYGVVDANGAQYGYLGFARGALTCSVSYRWFDLEMTEDCAECAFAQTGTLGSPSVEANNGCGDATDLEGVTIGYGHGRAAGPFPGYFALHRFKAGAWRVADGAYSVVQSDDAWQFFTPTEAQPGGMEMPPPDDDELKGGGWDVRVNRETGRGEYAFIARDAAGEVTCDLFFPIGSAEANGGCADCEFAHDLNLGARQVRVNGAACAGAYDLSGITVTAGHIAPSTVVFEKQGRWTPAPGGTSAVDGADWHFSWQDG